MGKASHCLKASRKAKTQKGVGRCTLCLKTLKNLTVIHIKMFWSRLTGASQR